MSKNACLCWWWLKFRVALKEKIQYEQMCSYRAALYMPGVVAGKMTKHELVTMGLPTFFPSKEFQLQFLVPAL
eukprot:341584-Amphidinium_carterae.2